MARNVQSPLIPIKSTTPGLPNRSSAFAKEAILRKRGMGYFEHTQNYENCDAHHFLHLVSLAHMAFATEKPNVK